MYPYDQLHTDVRNHVVQLSLFDSYRLVDVKSRLVYSYPVDADEPVSSGSLCHCIWSRSKPCANCTSRACLDRGEQVIKIEQLGDRVFLINSIPVQVGERSFALELAKDVTSSLMVPDLITHDNTEITQVIGRLNDLAVRDGFTMLHNKTFVSNQMEMMVEEAQSEQNMLQPAVLVALDIDFFKEVNDRYGHATGDDVLLHFAHELKKLARTIDGGWAGRFGGDEFVLCAPNGMDDADEERIRAMIEHVESHPFEGDDDAFAITVSYGIARLQPGDTPRTFLDRADEAMYRVKRERHRQRAEAREQG